MLPARTEGLEFLFNHASRPFTAIFLRLCFSANTVTTLGGCIGIIGVALIWLGWFWFGYLSLIMYCIFDFSDGDVARALNSQSDFGGQLDCCFDRVIQILTFLIFILMAPTDSQIFAILICLFFLASSRFSSENKRYMILKVNPEFENVQRRSIGRAKSAILRIYNVVKPNHLSIILMLPLISNASEPLVYVLYCSIVCFTFSRSVHKSLIIRKEKI